MKHEGKICAAYIRVSTHDQEEYSPESQIRLLRDYAEKNGLLLLEEFIFRDDGISGRGVKKRTAFQDMIAAAKSDPSPFSVILVWKFSRFARNQEEAIVYKSMLRKDCGVDVVSITEPIMDGPFGTLIERIIEWQDEYYSINLGSEVRRGMAERAGRGLPVSPAPLGYTYKEKALAIVPEEADTVQMIYRDFLSGIPIFSIAKKLNTMRIKTRRGGDWEQRAVRYILTNPIYSGKIRWCKEGINDYHRNGLLNGTIIVDGEHEPIISSQDFEAAQERMREYLRLWKGHPIKSQTREAGHMLQGLVKCGSCGGTMTWTGTGMNCSRYIHGKCPVSHFISLHKLEALVLTAIRSQLGSLHFEVTFRETSHLAGERQRLQQCLKREQEILRRYRDAYASGTDTLEEYRENKRECQERIQNLRQSLYAIASPPHVSKQEFSQKHLETLETLKSDIPAQEKNVLLRSFVDCIVFHKEIRSLNITYYI